MSKVQHRIGGTQGYNINAAFPIGSGNMGGAFTAMDTVAATIYPEPATGNIFVAVNSASATALAYYTGSAWGVVKSA